MTSDWRLQFIIDLTEIYSDLFLVQFYVTLAYNVTEILKGTQCLSVEIHNCFINIIVYAWLIIGFFDLLCQVYSVWPRSLGLNRGFRLVCYKHVLITPITNLLSSFLSAPLWVGHPVPEIIPKSLVTLRFSKIQLHELKDSCNAFKWGIYYTFMLTQLTATPFFQRLTYGEFYCKGL